MGVWEQFLLKVASGPITSDAKWLLSLNQEGVKESFYWRNPKDKNTIDYAIMGDLTACKALLEAEFVEHEILKSLRESNVMDTSLMAALHPESSYEELLQTLDRWKRQSPAKFKGRLGFYLSSEFDVFQKFRSSDAPVREFILKVAGIETLTSFLKIIGDALGNSLTDTEEIILSNRIRSFSVKSSNFFPFLRVYTKYFYPKTNSLKTTLSAYLYSDKSLGELLRWWLNPGKVFNNEIVDRKLFSSMLFSLSLYSNDINFLESEIVNEIAIFRNPYVNQDIRVRHLNKHSTNLDVVRASLESMKSYYFGKSDSLYEFEARALFFAIVTLESKVKGRVKTGYLLRSFINVNSDRVNLLLDIIPPEYHFLLVNSLGVTMDLLLKLPAQAALLRYESPGELLSFLLSELEQGEVEIFASLVDEFDGSLESLIYVAKTCSSKGLSLRG